MDLMLALTEDGIHEVIWTEALLREWERVVTRDHRRSPAVAASIANAVREFFPDSEISMESYSPLVPDMPGNDPDDRVHMAAAVAGGATAIVTWNSKDFPAKALAVHGVHVTDPDSYLCALAADLSDEVLSTIDRMAEAKRRPPISTAQLLDALEKAGVAMFVALMR